MKHTVSVLQPVHTSVIKRGGVTPNRMSKITVPDEMRTALTRIAIDIFTDMSNANGSLQDALLAIYLSGLHHGQAINDERKTS